MSPRPAAPKHGAALRRAGPKGERGWESQRLPLCSPAHPRGWRSVTLVAQGSSWPWGRDASSPGHAWNRTGREQSAGRKSLSSHQQGWALGRSSADEGSEQQKSRRSAGGAERGTAVTGRGAANGGGRGGPRRRVGAGTPSWGRPDRGRDDGVSSNPAIPRRPGPGTARPPEAAALSSSARSPTRPTRAHNPSRRPRPHRHKATSGVLPAPSGSAPDKRRRAPRALLFRRALQDGGHAGGARAALGRGGCDPPGLARGTGGGSAVGPERSRGVGAVRTDGAPSAGVAGGGRGMEAAVGSRRARGRL